MKVEKKTVAAMKVGDGGGVACGGEKLCNNLVNLSGKGLLEGVGFFFCS